MLWTDALIVSSTDLNQIDPEASDIATVSGTTLDGVNGFLWRQVEDAGNRLLMATTSLQSFNAGSALSLFHMQAVLNTGLPANNRQRVLLDCVVVNGVNGNSWSHLKQWIVLRCLEKLMRTAGNRDLNDRYEKKQKQYKEDARSAWNGLIQLGLPIMMRPLACPMAVWGHNPGSFTVSAVSGSGAGGDYDVVVTYFDATQPSNNESHPSAVNEITLVGNQNLKVDITGLNPPKGQTDPIDIARSVVALGTATHWNVYVGQHGQVPLLQNSSPIPITTKTYSAPVTNTGAPVGIGQYAQSYMVLTDGQWIVG